MLKEILFVTILLQIEVSAHMPSNSSNFIIMGGHADLQREDYSTTKATTISSTIVTTTTTIKMRDSEESLYMEHEKEAVLFVPTEAPVLRNRDIESVHAESVRLSDLMDGKSVGRLALETESPVVGEVLFISGKNAENEKFSPINTNQHSDTRREMDFVLPTTKQPKIKLDCKNLDCHNEIGSICGAKYERSEWKYRLFLNECFFRKVNCGFNYEYNRYQQVDVSYCKNLPSHTRRTEIRQRFKQPVYVPIQPKIVAEEKKYDESADSRRIYGRRAMVQNFGASFCSHYCPTTCTDEYEPECALSATGERRVFANHCQLDYNSCQFQIMWRRRPLAECVGGQKADMRQNRAFIDWMQRMGIVDKKGKLVLQ